VALTRASRFWPVCAVLGLAAGLQACVSTPVAAPVAPPSGPAVSARTQSPAQHHVQVGSDLLNVQAMEEGTASWYGARFHGRLTANGEIFDKHELTAAHLTMDLPSLARVTRLDTGASIIVRVNDRGPYIEGRVIDLSRAAAEALDFVDEGLAEVRIEALGPADPEDRAAVSRIVRGPGAGRAAQR